MRRSVNGRFGYGATFPVNADRLSKMPNHEKDSKTPAWINAAPADGSRKGMTQNCEKDEEKEERAEKNLELPFTMHANMLCHTGVVSKAVRKIQNQPTPKRLYMQKESAITKVQYVGIRYRAPGQAPKTPRSWGSANTCLVLSAPLDSCSSALEWSLGSGRCPWNRRLRR